MGLLSRDFHAELTTHRMFAGGGLRTGDPSGRSAAPTTDTHMMFAGGKPTGSDF